MNDAPAPRWPVSRLAEAIRTATAPIVYLRLDPHAAGEALVDALIEREGFIQLANRSALGDGLRTARGGDGDAARFVARVSSAEDALAWALAAADLEADERLLVVGPEPLEPGRQGIESLAPWRLRFDRDALREAAPWIDDGTARRILEATGGWPGPTLFLCRIDHEGDLDGYLGQTPPLRFSLRLLGRPVVERLAPRPAVLRWRLRRSLLALARLARAPGREVSKDDLVATLFPDADRDAVARNFHPVLSDLRRTLIGPRPGPSTPGLDSTRRAQVLVARQGTYRLGAEIDWRLDTERFEQAVSESASAEREGDLERALAAGRLAWQSYGGDFLDGFDGEWASGERRRLRSLRLDSLRRVGDLAFAADRSALALDAYRALLLDEPYEEAVHLAVMELYARGGRRDRVRRQYVRLQDLLKELRVEPTPETQTRYHRLMR